MVLTSTHNLCFEQKYEKYQKFSSENFHFSVVKFSVYLNRRVSIMIWFRIFCIWGCNKDFLHLVGAIKIFCIWWAQLGFSASGERDYNMTFLHTASTIFTLSSAFQETIHSHPCIPVYVFGQHKRSYALYIESKDTADNIYIIKGRWHIILFIL